MKKVLMATVLILGLLGVGVGVASATLIFDLENDGVSPASNNYGTIALTLNADKSITVAVSMATNYRLGLDFAFNYEGTVPVSIGSISWTSDSSNANGWSAYAGTPHMDGFGNFDAGLTTPNGNDNHQYKTLSFTVSRSGGFSSLSELEELSTNGSMTAYFSTHVYPIATNGSTGYIGVSTVPVPEPGTLLLLGAGLTGLYGYRLRKRGKK